MSATELNNIPFFEGLPDQLRWHLSRAAERQTYDVGEKLFVDGDKRRALWVILEGTLAIELTTGDEPHRLATLGPGDVVGESILLGDETHHTEGRVLAQMVTLRFDRSTLEPLLKDQPRLHAALLGKSARVLAARLKAADVKLSGRDRAAGFGGPTRKEKDLLGERDVPQAALYGVQTLRAIENFPITGVTLEDFPELIVALAQVKEAAARANMEIGTLPADVGDAIVRACKEIAAGTHHEHFRVDMIQGGAGTSTNMNANEVIANRACELLGSPRGSSSRVHPNEHVNLAQSTNDACS